MKLLDKNGLPCSIHVLFAPGVVILPIELDLSDFFEFRFSLYKERTRRNTSVGTALLNEVKNPRLKCGHGHKSTAEFKGKG